MTIYRHGYAGGRRHPGRHFGRNRGSAGTSLVEALVASAILLIVAVGLMPLFGRATWNRISGADSSQATQLGQEQIENFFTVEYDDDSISLTGAGAVLRTLTDPPPNVDAGEERVISTMVYDTKNDITAADPNYDVLGIGGWIDKTAYNTAKGPVLWQRDSSIRTYHYSDISDGVINLDTGNVLTLGHAEFFDAPQKSTVPTSEINFVENRIDLWNRRQVEFMEDGITVEEIADRDDRPITPAFRVRFLRSY